MVVSTATLLAMLSGTVRPARCGTFLQAEVHHSDKLPPIQGFQLGSQFNEGKALESVKPSREWYRVPPWLSGRWTTNQYTETFFQDYISGARNPNSSVHNATLTERWGMQRDREGGTWDAIVLPFISTTESAHHIYKDLHTGDSLIFDSATKVIMVYRATRSTIDKASNTITKVQQFESFTTLTLAGPNLVKDEYSLKFFDQQGNPVQYVTGWRYETRIEPFSADNFENGEDLRPSFKAYLISQGLQDLVPQE